MTKVPESIYVFWFLNKLTWNTVENLHFCFCRIKTTQKALLGVKNYPLNHRIIAHFI